MPTSFSRRTILAGFGAAGASAVSLSKPAVNHAFAALDDRPFYFLTESEAQWLASICDVFIPEDDYPSASQAGVVDFIDMQLSSGWGSGEGLYLEPPFFEGTPEQGYQLSMTPAQLIRAGIEGLRGEGLELVDLGAQGRENAVNALSERENPIGDVPANTFFTMLLSLTNQGYFADPIYLGNKNYAGWEMVGFPGAHAYYLSMVDEHNRPYRKPPMGIAHDRSGRSTLPTPTQREEG